MTVTLAKKRGRNGTGFIDFGTGKFGLFDSEVTVWGFGLVQNIEAAAMDLYVGSAISRPISTLLQRGRHQGESVS